MTVYIYGCNNKQRMHARIVLYNLARRVHSYNFKIKISHVEYIPKIKGIHTKI